MITILVDEAYAFDYLSILNVKKQFKKEIEKEWNNCFSHIQNQIGYQKMHQIINSKEYFNMVEANKITFQAVENAKNNNISAKDVDDANMLRYKRKLELQNAFFEEGMTEKKI